MSKLIFNIPDYLSLKSYKQVASMDHLSDTEKRIKVLGILTDLEEEKVRELRSHDLAAIYTQVLEKTIELIPEFYPIIEIEGQLYGYVPFNKLSLGENADLERLTKDPQANIEEIIAILYRPILKHRFNSIKWKFKHSFKLAIGEAENLFEYYDVEKYDNKTRKERAEYLAPYFPASFALGALSFFLQVGNILTIASPISSLTLKEQKKAKKETVKMIKETLSQNIGGGLQLFITSRLHPSLTLQGIKLSQI